MKIALLLLITLTTLGAMGQTTRTYTSPNRGYSFSFPKSFPIFTDPARFEPKSYLAVCPQEAQVCVSYRDARLRRTNFGAAAFSVSVLPTGTTEAACKTSPESNFPPQPDVKIGSVAFQHFTTEDAAMSHSLTSQLYRSFHAGRCYELQASIMKTSFGVYPPGTKREFTTTAEQRVKQALDRIALSFRFHAS